MKNKKLLSLGVATILMGAVLIGCTDQQDADVINNPTEETSNVENKGEKKLYVSPEVSSGDEAMELLVAGNERYVNGELKNYDLGNDRRTLLAEGQKPHTVVVTCSDSRVAPEHLFDQGIGDIFVIRVAGNILDKAEIGSIEYAVANLGSPLVVVLGHEDCGAVTAAVNKVLNPEDSKTTENIDAFLDNIEPAVKVAVDEDAKLEGQELIEKVADLNVEMSLDQLLKDSELIKTAVDDGKVKIVGAKYELSSGNAVYQ